MPKAIMVFDIWELPQAVYNPLQLLGGEVYHGNGGYISWEVGGIYDDNTLGYMSDAEAIEIEAFFKSARVVEGTHVLIYNWW